MPAMARETDPKNDGAEDGTRTRDLLITNQLLYQLSYFGVYLGNDASIGRRRTLSIHCFYTAPRGVSRSCSARPFRMPWQPLQGFSRRSLRATLARLCSCSRALASFRESNLASKTIGDLVSPLPFMSATTEGEWERTAVQNLIRYGPSGTYSPGSASAESWYGKVKKTTAFSV